MISASESRAAISRLAALVHPRGSRIRIFAMLDLKVAGDASESGRVFCVAGYMAPLREWDKLERPWRAALKEESLNEFKAADCEHQREEFAGRSLDDCQRIWERFVQLIHSVKLFACATVVDRDAWKDLNALFVGRLGPAGINKYSKPYYPAFLWTVGGFATQIIGLAPEELITFTFDRDKEYKGKAKYLYDLVLRQDFPISSRLGPCVFEDSRSLPALQAADMLAYEVMKYFKEAGLRKSPVRPQWQRLVVAGDGAEVRYMDRPRAERLGRAVELAVEALPANFTPAMLNHALADVFSAVPSSPDSSPFAPQVHVQEPREGPS